MAAKISYPDVPPKGPSPAPSPPIIAGEGSQGLELAGENSANGSSHSEQLGELSFLTNLMSFGGRVSFKGLKIAEADPPLAVLLEFAAFFPNACTGAVVYKPNLHF